jgi:hypothetical protein
LSVAKLGTQHRDARWSRTRYAKDVMLLMSVDGPSQSSQIGNCSKAGEIQGL